MNAYVSDGVAVDSLWFVSLFTLTSKLIVSVVMAIRVWINIFALLVVHAFFMKFFSCKSKNKGRCKNNFSEGMRESNATSHAPTREEKALFSRFFSHVLCLDRPLWLELWIVKGKHISLENWHICHGIMVWSACLELSHVPITNLIGRKQQHWVETWFEVMGWWQGQ